MYNVQSVREKKKRRSFTSNQKLEILKESKTSSVSAAARKHGITTAQLFTWRRDFEGTHREPMPKAAGETAGLRSCYEEELMQLQALKEMQEKGRGALESELNSGKISGYNFAVATGSLTNSACKLSQSTLELLDRLRQFAPPTTEQPVEEGFDDPDIRVQRTAEKWVYALVRADVENQERIAAGLPPLDVDEEDDSDEHVA